MRAIAMTIILLAGLAAACGSEASQEDDDAGAYIVKLRAMMAAQTGEIEGMAGQMGTSDGQRAVEAMQANVNNWKSVSPPPTLAPLHQELTAAFEQQLRGADLYIRGYYPGGLAEMNAAIDRLETIFAQIDAAPAEATRAADSAALFATATALAR